MTTTTVIESPHHQVKIRLQSKATKDQTQLFSERKQLELVRIFQAYQTWEDPLSNKLIDWSHRLFRKGTEIKNDDFHALLCELSTKILIHPLDRMPLQSPFLERGRWIWEERIYNHYQELKKTMPVAERSPYDNQLVGEVKVHKYAVEMIEWLHSFHLRDQTSKNGIDIDLLSQANTPLVRVYTLLTFAALAYNSHVVAQRDEQETREKKIAAIARELWEQANKKIEEVERKAKESLQKMKQDSNQKVDQLKETFDQMMSLLRNRLEALKTELNLTKKRLEKTEKKCEDQARRIDSLQAQVFCLSRKIYDLEREAESGGGFFGFF